jgi:thioredoxin reductase
MSAVQVAIIGAGPAGLTAAVQLRRYGISALLLEGERPGGLLHNANLVENYPGFPGGIPGADLVRLFTRQASQVGVQVTPQAALRIEHGTQGFHVHTETDQFQATVLVLATGTRPVAFPDAFLPAAARQRVFYEVHPLRQVAGMQVAIVGAGDAAFDYALNLARRNQVVILNRGTQVSCLPLLWERSLATPQIAYQPATRVVKLSALPDGRLRLECETPQGGSSLEVDYLIGALGRLPRVELLSGIAAGIAAGIADVQSLQSSGVLHIIGDVQRGRYRQTAIAVGDGMLAAMKIYQYLKEA